MLLPRQAMALQMSMYTCRTCSQFVHGIEGRKSLTGLGFMKWSSREQALRTATAQYMAFKRVREDTTIRTHFYDLGTPGVA